MDNSKQALRDGLIDKRRIMKATDTFTLEGHDTTPAGMTYTLLLLAYQFEAQETIVGEIANVPRSVGRDESNIDDSNKQECLKRVVSKLLFAFE